MGGEEPAASGAVRGHVGRALLPIVVTAAILAVLPSLWFGDSPYTTSLAVQALVFASYGVGFNLIFGSTNQLFLCVGALAGVGGYGAAILSDKTSLPTGGRRGRGNGERGDRRRAPELDRGAALARASSSPGSSRWCSRSRSPTCSSASAT